IKDIEKSMGQITSQANTEQTFRETIDQAISTSDGKNLWMQTVYRVDRDANIKNGNIQYLYDTYVTVLNLTLQELYTKLSQLENLYYKNCSDIEMSRIAPIYMLVANTALSIHEEIVLVSYNSPALPELKKGIVFDATQFSKFLEGWIPDYYRCFSERRGYIWKFEWKDPDLYNRTVYAARDQYSSRWIAMDEPTPSARDQLVEDYLKNIMIDPDKIKSAYDKWVQLSTSTCLQ
ncbi:MAG: hypothetical protein JW795_09890, partial [Chitinivibrionales bacterium]|nr:hypothetical protein [Chitinivibrionales bacterium]